MNTANQQHPQAGQDYRSAMQAAAYAFLERHQAEHLVADQLFDRACVYLVQSLDVPLFLAQRLVHLAMTRQCDRPRPWVGIDRTAGADATAVVLVDNRTLQRAAVSRRVLPTHLLPPYQQ